MAAQEEEDDVPARRRSAREHLLEDDPQDDSKPDEPPQNSQHKPADPNFNDQEDDIAAPNGQKLLEEDDIPARRRSARQHVLEDNSHDDIKRDEPSQNSQPKPAIPNFNAHKIVLNDNIITTDGGTLSYFGDVAHEDLDIRIIDTEEIKGKLLKHTAYIIESTVNNHHTVSRRYNDFKWLHNVLSIEFLCMFVPPIPPSSTASNILQKFDADFVSQRRYDLERFLNRVFKNKLMAKSQALDAFLTQQSPERFEVEKTAIRSNLLSRPAAEITQFIKNCYPDIDFSATLPLHKHDHNDDDNEDEKQPAVAELTSPRETDEEHKLYMEEIPRIREIYMRCDEKFDRIAKTARSIFQIMTHIVTEISALNEHLYGLQDIEKKERPQCMANEWIQREEVCAFVTQWRKVEQNAMYCWYKYWLLNLKYEHQDCLAILDIFVRWDFVFGKYKRLMTYYAKKKQEQQTQATVPGLAALLGTGGGGGGVTVDQDEEEKPDDDDAKKEQEEVGKEEQVQQQGGSEQRKVDDRAEIAEIKTLLQVVCKLIIHEQMPKLWEMKAQRFNANVEEFRMRFVECSLDEQVY